MLYRLEIENFFSIRDEMILDLTVAANVPDDEGRFGTVFFGSAMRAPKVVALYGANASGKTTILKAIDFLAMFIRDSASNTGEGFPVERFNDEASKNRPIRLAVEFGGVMDLSPAIQQRLDAGLEVEHGLYRYELELAVVDGVVVSVGREALRQRPQGRGKWQRVFEREGGEVVGSKAFGLSGYRHLLNTLRPNASVLSSFALFQHPPSMLYVETARLVISNLHLQTQNDAWTVSFLKQSPDLIERLNRDLSRIDIGVEAMRIVDNNGSPAPLFRHCGLDVEMPWALESHGTRAFIRLFPFLSIVLQRGGVALVDEFDTLIHPLVLPDILRWFYDTHDRNRDDAQIWVSVHSASLLDDLVKEEVVLCEKDGRGRTTAYSLMDVKALRRDENLYRKYLSGALGAVPSLG